VSGLVLLEVDGPVATLTLNRPRRHNSLVPALLEALLVGLQAVAGDESVRAVVLQGNGRSFSTGGDLKGFVEHLDGLEAYARQIVGLLNRAILALVDLPVPVVAAVQGQVSGGSLGLVLASDLVLLAPDAAITPFYGVVGFSPDGGWASLLPALIGPKAAGYSLYTNQPITAEMALAHGLASRIVPAGDLRREAGQVARQIATMEPGSVRRTKRLLWAGREELAARLKTELEHFLDQIATRSARESMLAFMDRLERR
jgi:2-(1,2-epoxy-1,2-dihydrophenyl)acetyl-CoA isomerase